MGIEMPTRVKPKHFGGVDQLTVAAEIDDALNQEDYRTLMRSVPLKATAGEERLKADLRIAAIWYVIESRLRQAPKANEIKAALTKFAGQPDPSLEELDIVSRRLLWEQAEAPPPAFDESGEPIAWRSPIEDASPERLRCLARAAAAKIRPRRGAKPHIQQGLKVLLTAWKQATGRFGFTETKNRTEFLEFVRLLIGLLRRKGFNVAAPSRRQMVRAMKLIR
jgi:hypothetical protein